jgi:hypothetical protein
MSSVYQVGCRLSRYHRLLQWFTYPPVGTIFTPADVLNNNILLSICAFLNANWNLWGGEEVRNLCMIADYILDVYQQQEIIDLTLGEEPMDEEPMMDGQWIVLDEVHEQQGPDGVSEYEDSEESEEEFDSHSESDYSTSESEDSGVEV